VPLSLVQMLPNEVAVEIQVLFNTGSVRLTLSQSEAGSYEVELTSTGLVTLARAGQVIGTAQVTANTPDVLRTLRLSAIGNLLRVSVDGVEVMTAFEPSLLPGGVFSLRGEGLDAAGLRVEGVRVWVPGMAVVGLASPQQAGVAPDIILPQPTAVSGANTGSLTGDSFSVQSSTTCPATYVMRQVNTFDEIRQAVTDSNGDPNNTYVLTIEPGTYGFNVYPTEVNGMNGSFSMLSVERCVIFIGTYYQATHPHELPEPNAVIFTKANGAPEFDLLKVNSGANVKVYNIIFNGGGGPTRSTGGNIVNHGTLTIYNSVIRDGIARYGGGMVNRQESTPSILIGNATIINTWFENNQALLPNAGLGGAIENLGGVFTGNCLIFSDNYSTSLFGSSILNRTSTDGNFTGTMTFDKVYFTSTIGQTSNSVDHRTGVITLQNSTGPNSRVGWSPTSLPPASVFLVYGSASFNPPVSQIVNNTNMSLVLDCEVPPPPDPNIIPGNGMDIATVSLPVPVVPGSIMQSLDTQFQPQANGDYPDVVTIDQIPGAEPCDRDDDNPSRIACSSYAYMAFYQLYESITGQAPKVWDLLTLVYNLELNTFSSPSATQSVQFGTGWSLSSGQLYQDIAFEALARNFFDFQSGACRYSAQSDTYNCNYQNVVTWLGTIHSVYNRAVPINNSAQVTIKIVEILGFDTDSPDFETIFVDAAVFASTDTNYRSQILNVGMFKYETDVLLAIDRQLVSWRTGQGGNLPSNWGNVTLTVAATAYAPPPSVPLSEIPMYVIIHQHSASSPAYTYGTNIAPSSDIVCTYVALVITSDGNVSTSACS
jgi:hypothetical protein